ncbi:MAG: DUF6293 family protein [Candidatus Thorarchaeota archaeon]
MTTLQIATIGEDTDPVLTGLKNVPSQKLHLICLKRNEKAVHSFAAELGTTLHLDIEVHAITKPIIMMVLEKVSSILREYEGRIDDIVINVAAGEKPLTCGALTAAFFNGLKAFHIMEGALMMFPIMRMSYSSVISQAKMNILQGIQKAEGVVKDLGQLSELTGYGKPLLSYHIRGDDESRGLVDLGLIQAEHKRRGRLQVTLTTLGKAMLLGQSEYIK